jgi:hypothetical protein
MNIQTTGLALAAALCATTSIAQTANSSFFSVRDYYYPTSNGDFAVYNTSGFAQPQAPGISPALFILPTLVVEEKDIKFFRPNGLQVDPRVYPGAEIGSVSIVPRVVTTMPNAMQIPAIAANLKGLSVPQFLPPPLRNGGQIVMTPEAGAFWPIRSAIETDTLAYEQGVTAQGALATGYGTFSPKAAPLNQLEVHLLIGDERAASKTYPGTTTTLGQITLLRPSEFQKNQLIEGNFELLVMSRFPDVDTKYISANFDAYQAVTSFVEETQRAITKSKSSGFQVLGFGSRRSKMKTSMSSSMRTDDKLEIMQSTTVVMFDASDDMVKQFESDFFPELAKQEVIDKHLEAAAAARAANNLGLAKVHEDYAAAITSANQMAEVDSVAAAAALSAGDYAGFLANGVRSINSNDTKANEFRRVVNSRTEIEQKTFWSQTRQVTVLREVSVPVLMERPVERMLNLGICGMRMDVPYSWYQFGPYGVQAVQKKGLMVSCVTDKSPMPFAGIVPGTIIQKVGGSAVSSVTEFENALEGYRPGQSVTIQTIQSPGPTSPVSQLKSTSVILTKGPPKQQ